MADSRSLFHQSGRKDPDCPNCGGRSFSAIDPGDYYECGLCERPTERFHDYYRSRWPKLYAKWAEGRC